MQRTALEAHSCTVRAHVEVVLLVQPHDCVEEGRALAGDGAGAGAVLQAGRRAGQATRHGSIAAQQLDCSAPHPSLVAFNNNLPTASPSPTRDPRIRRLQRQQRS